MSAIMRAALVELTQLDGSEDNVANQEVLAARVRRIAREALVRSDREWDEAKHLRDALRIVADTAMRALGS